MVMIIVKKYEFRCYEVKIDEKAGSHQELNPGHLWLEPLSEGRMSPRAECPPGRLALGHNVPPDISP